jgi:S-formylglutathione hydrolase
MNPATTRLFDLDSAVMGTTVPVAVVLPPDFQPEGESLPLLINLHGGDGDRNFLVAGLPHFQSMWETGELPPLVMVTFSSGGTSWYVGNWEKFVVDELSTYMNTRFNTRLDREGIVLTGSSMGGYGALKIAFKYPERFSAIASLEAAVEPFLTRTPGNHRNTWYRMEAIESRIWGSPFDEAAWEADNPATIAYRNADAIRDSGLDIYLEVGDQDYLNLHDGNEFLHRVLWDHDIRHEYHLVRWADHIGFSMERRAREVYRFLAASLAGGLAEPADLPLTEKEQAYINWATGGDMAAGEPPPTQEDLMADMTRGPSLLRGLFGPSRDRATGDTDLQRAYARLPPTSL